MGCFGDFAYAAEEPFSPAFEEGTFYGGSLEGAHINDEGKVVYALVRPAVGSGEDIVKVVVVGDTARDVVFVGMLEDIHALFELGFEVVDIPEINIVTILISIEGVEVYALYFSPLGIEGIGYVGDLVREEGIVQVYRKIKHIGVVSVLRGTIYIAIGAFGFEAYGDFLVFLGVEELVIDGYFYIFVLYLFQV